MGTQVGTQITRQNSGDGGFRKLSTASIPPTPRRTGPEMDRYREITRQLVDQFIDTGRISNPETFLTSLLTVMTHYPIEICEVIADPFCGLPGRQEKLPTPFAIRQLGEELMGPIRRQADRHRLYAQQQLDRIEQKSLEEDRGHRETMEQIEERLAARGMYLNSYRKRRPDLFGTNGQPHGETPESVRQKFGLTPEQWAALPDRHPTKEPINDGNAGLYHGLSRSYDGEQPDPFAADFDAAPAAPAPAPAPTDGAAASAPARTQAGGA